MSAHGREHDQLDARDRGDRGMEAPEPDPVERLASGIGNRAFTELARHGEGILPDGRAHPDVEPAIAARRGGGSASTRASASASAPGSATTSATSACTRPRRRRAGALGVGPRVHDRHRRLLRRRRVPPGTAAGDRLLAHELTHVVQQRGAPTTAR